MRVGTPDVNSEFFCLRLRIVNTSTFDFLNQDNKTVFRTTKFTDSLHYTFYLYGYQPLYNILIKHGGICPNISYNILIKHGGIHPFKQVLLLVVVSVSK